MASGKGHLVGGAVFLWLFLIVISNYFFVPTLIETVIFSAIIILFSVWPDVDINSIGQKIFYSIFFVTDALLIFYFKDHTLAAYFGLLIILPVLAKHRGWTHWKSTAIILPLPIIVAPMSIYGGTLVEGIPFYCAAVTGYFSHLFFDGELF